MRGASGGVLERGRIGACGRSFASSGLGGRKPNAGGSRLPVRETARPTLRWGRGSAPARGRNVRRQRGGFRSKMSVGRRDTGTFKSKEPAPWRPAPLFSATHSGRRDRESNEACTHTLPCTPSPMGRRWPRSGRMRGCGVGVEPKDRRRIPSPVAFGDTLSHGRGLARSPRRYTVPTARSTR